MPTPNTQIVIGAKSASLSTGDYVTLKNLTRGEKETVKCNSSGEVILDNLPETWITGDSIAIEVFGRFNSATVVTLSENGVNHDFGTLTADTSTKNINL